MTRLFRKLLPLVVVAALALPATAQDDALSLVPADAVSVGMLQLAELRSSPLSAFFFQHIDRMSTNGEGGRLLLEAGLRPLQDVDALVVATSPRNSVGTEADVLVIAEGRFQPQRLAAVILARGAVTKGAYLLLPEAEGEAPAVAFLSQSLVIAGNEQSVVKAIAAYATGGTGFARRGALAMDLGRIDPAATAWALVDVQRAARLAKGGTVETGNGQQGAALRAALKTVSTVALWAKDTGNTLEVGATGVSHDPETMRLVEDALRGALAAARLAVQDKAPEMVSVLRRFDIDRNADSIRIEGSVPAAVLQQLLAKTLASMNP